MTSIIGTANHVHRQNASTGSGQASVQRVTGSRASQVAFTWRLLVEERPHRRHEDKKHEEENRHADDHAR